jgi:DNA-directed RNA polymerase subunit RPC12/RpoP
MSSLERLVERLVHVRLVECPHCKLDGVESLVTVRKRGGRYCKTAKCPRCGHRINVPFSVNHVVEHKVVEHLTLVRESNTPLRVVRR